MNVQGNPLHARQSSASLILRKLVRNFLKNIESFYKQNLGFLYVAFYELIDFHGHPLIHFLIGLEINGSITTFYFLGTVLFSTTRWHLNNENRDIFNQIAGADPVVWDQR